MALYTHRTTDSRNTLIGIASFYEFTGLILCFMGLFAVFGKPNRQTDKRTDGRTDATKRIISPASRSIISCPNHGLLKQQCYMRMEHCQLHPSPFPHGVTHLQTMFFLWKVGRLWVDKFFGRPFLCPSENIALI